MKLIELTEGRQPATVRMARMEAIHAVKNWFAEHPTCTRREFLESTMPLMPPGDNPDWWKSDLSNYFAKMNPKPQGM